MIYSNMLKIRNNLSNFYFKLPIFYKVYALTSGITYLYFPETLNTILINTGCIVTSELIDKLDIYVQTYHQEKILLNEFVFFSNIVAKIGSFGVVSGNFQKLKIMHNSVIGFGYQINSYLLQSIISGARYSVVWGTVSTITTWCITKIFEKNFKLQINDLILKIRIELDNMINDVIKKANDESEELSKLIKNTNNMLEDPKKFLEKLGITFSL